MKNWIIIALLLVSGIGLGIGVVAIHSTKTNIKRMQAASAAQHDRVEASIAATKQKQADEAKDALVTSLRAECGKGTQAYNALTVTQKKSLAVPVCN